MQCQILPQEEEEEHLTSRAALLPREEKSTYNHVLHSQLIYRRLHADKPFM